MRELNFWGVMVFVTVFAVISNFTIIKIADHTNRIEALEEAMPDLSGQDALMYEKGQWICYEIEEI